MFRSVAVFLICTLYLASGDKANNSNLGERHLPYGGSYYYDPEIDGSVGPYQYNPVQFPTNEGETTNARPGSTAIASCQCEAYCRAQALRNASKAPLRY